MKRILYGLATFFAVACFAGAHALRYAVLRWLTVNRWVMFFTNKMKALLPLSFLKTAVPLLLMALAVLLAVRALRRRPPRSRMLVPEALFGYRKMVLVGSDLPFLSAAQIRAGLSILDRCNCAVGPSEDGGYYLLGLRTPCADLFQGQAYGHGNVLENLLLRLRTLGMTWDLCPAAGDLDTRDDLLALLPRKEELRSNLRRFLESLEVEGPCRI